MAYNELNGPSVYGFKSVTTTPSELRVGGSALAERVAITMQPTDGIIYYGFDSGVTASTGTKVFRGQVIGFEAGAAETVYMVAASGTVNVRITERS